MSDLTLGTTPARLTLWLVDAAPFAASVTADNAFPAPPELVFDTGTVWPATLDEDGTTAAWLHPAADVDALAALSPRRVTLRDPASHHVWAHGTVYVARVVDSGEASTVAPGGSITVEQLDGAVSITYVVGEGGPGGGVTDHGDLTGLEGDDHPQYLTEQRGDARYATATHDHDGVYVKPADLPAPPDLSDVVRDDDPRLTDPRTPTSHDHTAAEISDATTAGRAVMQASSPTAARTAIGAGTSNLQLGTGPTTAAAGNHGHDLNAVTDTASRVAMTPVERTKLSGVASGATANATDAQLRDRATHTGAQAISTVTGLQSALDDHEGRVAELESRSGTSGTGILNVSGTVNLDDAPGIREVYATASATVEGVALTAGDAAVFRYLAGAWTYMVVGEHTTWQTVPTGGGGGDTTPPTGGTLVVTGTGDAGTTRTLTVTGASDEVALHATPYRFSIDGGTTWSTYQASNVYTTGALAAGTYQPRVMVRDAAGNTATASAADFTLTAVGMPFTDNFTAADNTDNAGRTVAGYTWANDTNNDTNVGVLGAGKIWENAVRMNSVAGVMDVGQSKVRVSADVAIPANVTGGAAIRLMLGGARTSGGAHNSLYVMYDGNNGFKMYRPGPVQVGANSTVVAGFPMSGRLSLEWDGTTATAKWNGTAIITGPVSGITGTKVGYGGGGVVGAPPHPTLDNFTVEALP